MVDFVSSFRMFGECLEFDLLVYMGFHPWCLGVVNALIWGGKGDHT